MPFFSPSRRTAVRVLLTAVIIGGGLAAGASASFGSTERTYVVQPGDTLWSISQADGVSMQSLAAANGMVLSDILLAGRTLVIPGTAGDADVPVVAVATAGGVTTASAVTPTADACAQGPGNPWGVLPERLVASGGEALVPIFREWSAAYGVSSALVEAIAWEESGWQQGVVSPAGAVGIGQLLPSTATFVSQDLIGVPLDVYSVDDNIRMTARYVAYLAALEGGNLCHTIAAYYEGAGAVASVGVLPMSVPYVADIEALMPRFE